MAKIYALEAGQELYFSIGTHGTQTGVTTVNLPITHPGNLTLELTVMRRVYVTQYLFLEYKLLVATSWKLKFTHCICAAYYQLSRKDREIVDSLSAIDGTTINYKMMEIVIQYVHNIEHLVELHGAGDYVEGTTPAMVHTLK